MPIKLDCPRCKKPLAVPSKKAGSYVNCPHCNGRFWVPEQKKTGPPAPGGASTPPTVDAPPVQAPVPGRKVARFVSAEVAQSTLQTSEDGQLPDLHLQEGDKKRKQQTRERTVSPALLFSVLSMSVVLSVMMALYDAGPQRDADAKAEVRKFIQDKHFTDAGVAADLENAPPLKPYQRLLREAQLAHEQKDYRTERRKYREVLDLLREEQGPIDDTPGVRREFEGVTGRADDDRELERWIRTLLKED